MATLNERRAEMNQRDRRGNQRPTAPTGFNSTGGLCEHGDQCRQRRHSGQLTDRRITVFYCRPPQRAWAEAAPPGSPGFTLLRSLLHSLL